MRTYRTDEDVPNVRNRDPDFLQLHPLVMCPNSKGRARPFERVGPVEVVPDDGV